MLINYIPFIYVVSSAWVGSNYYQDFAHSKRHRAKIKKMVNTLFLSVNHLILIRLYIRIMFVLMPLLVRQARFLPYQLVADAQLV